MGISRYLHLPQLHTSALPHWEALLKCFQWFRCRELCQFAMGLYRFSQPYLTMANLIENEKAAPDGAAKGE